MEISISGREEVGSYSVRCSCGQYWRGRALPMQNGTYNPALPIAEAVVHFRLIHATARLEVVLDEPYSFWLQRYWEAVNQEFQALFNQ